MMKSPKITSHRAWFIYVLRDPRTNDARYVGFTVNLESRLCAHIEEAACGSHTHKCCWIRELLSLGFAPAMDCLEEGCGSGWQEREKHWIKTFRLLGESLTNATEGGDGGAIRFGPLDESHKRKISFANKGRGLGNVPSEITRQRLSESGKKSWNLERRQKQNYALSGRILTQEQKKNYVGRRGKRGPLLAYLEPDLRSDILSLRGKKISDSRRSR